ncbi:PLP-dependent aminotransferase family protein [Streptosporangiaceae bacterium NEAU-GS5]|nr:PLP-dependent aminotransferase family protein [Streptosporangiaceae bacterium NEAU-GS5]
MADLHVTIDRVGGAPGGFAAQVARELREAVRSGRLSQGTRLPSSRDLARDLGLSRGVVVEAYEQLVAEGFLESRVGVGTRVAAQPAVHADGPAPPAESHYGHRPTSPDLGCFPRQAWLGAVRQVLSTVPNDALDYGDPGGVRELREELAGYLRRVRAADAVPGNVVVTTGVAQGLSLAVHALRPVVLAVEDPSSARQIPLLRRAGATLVKIPVDGEGLDVAALRRTRATAALVTPAHHYPTGVVLSPRRRADLVAWAAETGGTIIEDDYDAEFRFDRDPVGCLQGLAPDLVVLSGSVSKSLAPGLRLGWMVAPPRIAGSVRQARGEFDLGSPVIDQYALAHFIRTGGYDRHLRRMRREYRARRDAMVAALAGRLPEAKVHGIEAGLHLYVELPDTRRADAVVAAARLAGLSAESVTETSLALGFARLGSQRLTAAVAALAELIDHQNVRTKY